MALSHQNRMKVISHIENQANFKQASISGRMTRWDDEPMQGEMPNEDYAELIKSVRATDTYVVFSYNTPIAWVTSDGKAVVPDARYSATTSQHQGIVRQACRQYRDAA